MSFQEKLIAGMHKLVVTMFDSPFEAPKYEEKDGWKAAIITKAVVVGQGTKGDKPTVDFQFEDEAGNKYVGMLTGELVKTVAKAVEGVHTRTNGNG